MRILIHDFAGHPFQVQLSRKLAERGHDVLHVHCESVVTGKGALELTPSDPETLRIRSVAAGQRFARHSVVRRLTQEVAYGRRLAGLIGEFEPDWVISANTPLVAQWILLRATKRAGASFLYWLQDLISAGAKEFLRRRLPERLAHAGAIPTRALEGRMLRASTCVVPISEGFRSWLDALGVDSERVTVIENWAPLEEIPVLEKDNAWACRAGLADTFVFLYAGTLGIKHDAELLLRLGEAIEGSARLVVVSEGSAARDLAEGSSHLTAVDVVPFQPFEDLPSVLASADVLVALLSPQAAGFSVPSKVLSYLCAGRAILLVMSGDAAFPRWLETNRAAAVVDAGMDPDRLSLAFVNEAKRLMDDEELRRALGSQARALAEQAFDIERIADKFESVLASALPGGQGTSTALRLDR